MQTILGGVRPKKPDSAATLGFIDCGGGAGELKPDLNPQEGNTGEGHISAGLDPTSDDGQRCDSVLTIQEVR